MGALLPAEARRLQVLTLAVQRTPVGGSAIAVAETYEAFVTGATRNRAAIETMLDALRDAELAFENIIALAPAAEPQDREFDGMEDAEGHGGDVAAWEAAEAARPALEAVRRARAAANEARL